MIALAHHSEQYAGLLIQYTFCHIVGLGLGAALFGNGDEAGVGGVAVLM